LTQTVLLDETVLLIALLPKRRVKADFCAWRFEDASASSDVTLVVRLPVADSVRRKVRVACALAEKLFLLCESLQADPSVAVFHNFVRHLSRRVSYPQLREVLIHVLACCRLLSRTWLPADVGPDQQYKELKKGFGSLKRRARESKWLERTINLAEPHMNVRCNGDLSLCPRRRLLKSFVKKWGPDLLKQVKDFMREEEQDLRQMVAGAGSRIGSKLSDEIRGNLVARIRTMVQCCCSLHKRAREDGVLLALAEWAWQKWQVIKGVILVLRLCKEFGALAPDQRCECCAWEDATTLALGTMGKWGQHEEAQSEEYEGADTLLSFNQRLHFMKSLRAPVANPVGVECRRDFRIALADPIDLEIDGQWHEVALISLNLKEHGLAVTGDALGIVPYKDAVLVRSSRFDDPRPFVPLSSCAGKGVRLRSLSDSGEDPIQDFVEAVA